MKLLHAKSGVIKANTRPGSVMYTGKKSNVPLHIELIKYNQSEYQRKEILVSDLKNLDTDTVNWVNISGVHDISVIEEIGKIFKIDSLVLEDITTIGSRPKYDDYDDYKFFLLAMLSLNNSDDMIEQEQLSILFIKNVLITFQEKEGDIFDFLRNRIIESKGKIRTSNASYLFYSIIDAVVDQYFYIINELDKNIESLESDIIEKTSEGYANHIYNFRRILLGLKSTIWPVRDMLNELISDDDWFSSIQIKHLQDVRDNIIQIIDTISTYKDLVMGLYEIYLSNISNKMNRIMTTLTIISVIFIPLTFLAGIFGMNFKNMPILNSPIGYQLFWVFCVLISLSMVIVFKRKNWFK